MAYEDKLNGICNMKTEAIEHTEWMHRKCYRKLTWDMQRYRLLHLFNMKCINLGEHSEYEAKLKFYMMPYMRKNV